MLMRSSAIKFYTSTKFTMQRYYFQLYLNYWLPHNFFIVPFVGICPSLLIQSSVVTFFHLNEILKNHYLFIFSQFLIYWESREKSILLKWKSQNSARIVEKQVLKNRWNFYLALKRSVYYFPIINFSREPLMPWTKEF